MATAKRKKADLNEVKELFPSIEQLHWEKAMEKDFSLFARLFADVIKTGYPSGRPGPRSGPDQGLSLERLLGNDYSIKPFHEAIREIWHQTYGDEISVRKLADVTELDRNICHKLLNGKATPDSFEMVQIAKAFGRRPSYFLEYRIGFVLRFLFEFMMKYPESSIRSYLKTLDQVGKEQ